MIPGQNDQCCLFRKERRNTATFVARKRKKEIQKIKAERERQRSMQDKLKQRRNAVCVMLMPREYFTALSHFELLHTLKGTGLI